MAACTVNWIQSPLRACCGTLVLVLIILIPLVPLVSADGQEADDGTGTRQNEIDDRDDGRYVDRDDGRHDDQGRGDGKLALTNLTASLSGHHLNVNWTTDREASSSLHIRIRTNSSQGEGDWFTLKNLTLSRDHTMTTMLPFGAYQFYVESEDEGGNRTVMDNNGFYYELRSVTLAITGLNTSKSSVLASSLRTEEVAVTWYTNLPADGSIYIGGTLIGTTVSTTTHQVWIHSFSVEQGYQYSKIIFRVVATHDDLMVEQFGSIIVIQGTITTPSFAMGAPLFLLAALVVTLTAGRIRQLKQGGRHDDRHDDGKDGGDGRDGRDDGR